MADRTDVATVSAALLTTAVDAAEYLEELKTGLFGLMGMLGDREETMEQCAEAAVALRGVILKFTGDEKRKGIVGVVREVSNELAQGNLFGGHE